MGVDLYGMDFDAYKGEHDAGHGFSYTLLYADEARTKPVAVAEYHKCEVRTGRRHPDDPDDFDAAAILPLNVPEAADWHKGRNPKFGPGPKWDLVQAEPLTVAPSILCRACGLHGFLRAGRWAPC